MLSPPPSAAAVASDGLPNPLRRWATAGVILAIALAVLDNGIANVALPTIAAELDASPSATVWVVNGYQLAVAVTLLPFAALAEVVTYRRVFLFGIALFTLASLGCALAPSLPVLIAMRVVQGLGGACVTSITPALIRSIYPRAMLGQGIGIVGATVGVSSALGPTLAAAILSVAQWEWLFLVNVPVGIAAFAISRGILPAGGGGAKRVDAVSALLNAAVIGGLVFAVDEFGQMPAAILIVIAAGSVAAAALLWWRDRNRPAPLVPFDLLRMPSFALAAGTAVFSYIGLMIAFVVLPFYLQGELRMSAVQTGLLMTPWPLAIALVGPVAGRLGDRYPAGLLSSIGLALMTAGLIALALLPAEPSTPDIVWRMVLGGIGFGLFQSPNNRAMMNASPRNRSAAASGALATARLTGLSLGAAVAAAALAVAPAHATPISLSIAAVLAALGAIVSLSRLGADAGSGDQ